MISDSARRITNQSTLTQPHLHLMKRHHSIILFSKPLAEANCCEAYKSALRHPLIDASLLQIVVNRFLDKIKCMFKQK